MARARACRCASASLVPALLQHPLAIGRQLTLHLLDESWQRGLGVGADGEVDFRHVLEILKVALDEEIGCR